jgi:hypothetical protein
MILNAKISELVSPDCASVGNLDFRNLSPEIPEKKDERK